MLEIESGTVSSGNEPSKVKELSFLPVKIVMAPNETKCTCAKHKMLFPAKKLSSYG